MKHFFKKIALLCVLFQFINFCAINAQNLVPNPSFEQNTNCPNNFGQIGYAQFWYSPTPFSADYYNSCATTIAADVPLNSFGSEAALTGDGYAGFWAYGNSSAFRSYVGINLSEPLKADSTYCISFNVSLADFTYTAVQNIGVNISTNPADLGAPADIENTGGVIDNKDGWTTITANYTATGGEQWIIIGNFNSNVNTVKVADGSVDPTATPFYNNAYYYLDDVSVVEMPTLVVNSPSPVCKNEPFELTALGGGSYEWYYANNPFVPISTANFLQDTLQTTTDYILVINNGACSRTKTFTVEVQEVPMPNFTVLPSCAGATTFFEDLSTFAGNNASYTWSFGDGSTANTLGGAAHVYNSAGTYNVTLSIVNQVLCSKDTTIAVVIDSKCNPCTEALNCVANPSAEIYYQCPDDEAQVEQSVYGYSQTSFGTSDYFSTCFNNYGNTIYEVGVPANYFGYQNAANGNAYTGFYAYYNSSYREYVTADFSKPLQAGKTYCVSFEVSLADSALLATDKIGAYISATNPAQQPTTLPLSYLGFVPQIENTANNFLTDKNNWVTIKAMYTATGGEQFITIGNFYDNASTSTQNVPAGADFSRGNQSYYFLDNIKVFETPDFELPQDTINLCEAEARLFKAQGDYCSFVWTTLNETIDTLSEEATLLVQNNSAGIYQYLLTATLAGNCVRTDTVTVRVIPMPNADFTVASGCAGAYTYFVNTTANAITGATYQWDFQNNGSFDAVNIINPSFQYTQAGTYSVKLVVTNPIAGCKDSVIRTVTIAPECDACDYSQDFVQNYSFENNTCPANVGEINLASNWESFPANSAELFESCATNSSVQVPANAFGNQAPYGLNSPSAYAGIKVYDGASPANKSFLTQMLAVSLQTNNNYCFRFQTSLAENSDYNLSNQDSIGLFLSNVPFAGAGTPGQFVPVTVSAPQATGWAQANTSFTANDSYQYITIGYFGTGGNFIGTNALGIGYYYIDALTLSGINFISNNVTICAGDSAVLSASTNMCYYGWGVGNNPTLVSADTFLVVKPTQTTTYTFYGSNGNCLLQKQVTVTVNQLPTFTLSNDVSICLGKNVPLLVTSTNNNLNYTWYSDAALQNVVSQTNFFDITVQDTSTYYVQAIDAVTGCSSTDSVVINPIALPIADAGASSVLCWGDSVLLAPHSGFQIQNHTYHWISSDGLLDTNSIAVYASPTDTTTYYLSVKNTITGCQNIDSVKVYVQPPYQALPNDTLRICAGTNGAILQHNGIPANAVSFAWNTQIGLSDYTAQAPFILDFLTDTTTYTLQYYSEYGCMGTANVVVAVLPVPTTAVLQSTTCTGDSARLYTFSNYGGENVSYVWSPADGLSCTTCPNPKAAPSATTVYTVKVTYPFANTCIDSSLATVFVTSTGIANAGKDTTVCLGNSVQLNAISSIDADSVRWTPIEGLSDATIPNPLATPSINTTYTVIFYKNGCTATDEVSISLENTGNPDITTPNGNIVCVLPLSPALVTYNLDYTGCEPLITTVNTNLPGATEVTSDTSFYHVSAFTGSNRIDTLWIKTCTQFSQNCDSLQVIFLYCDEPIDLQPNAVDTTTIGVTPVEIIMTVTDPDIHSGDTISSFTVSGVDNGQVFVGTNGIIFVPNEGFIGTETFTVQVCDQFLPIHCDITTVTINVLADNNQAPIVPDTLVTTYVNQSVTVCLDLTNADPEGDDLKPVIINSPSQHGVVASLGAGCYTYTPSLITNPDSFTVKICDIYNHCTITEIKINILPVPNNPPTVSDTLIGTLQNTAVVACLDLQDPENDNLTLSIINHATNGLDFSVADSCIVAYYPNIGFIGTDSIIVKVCDINNQCDTATVIIEVKPPVNQYPIADDKTIYLPYPAPTYADGICFEVTEPENEDLDVYIVSAGQSNGLFFTNDKCLTYFSNSTLAGQTDNVVVAFCDIFGQCDTATLTVVYAPADPDNNAPVVPNNTINLYVNKDTSFCIFVQDPEGQNTTTTITQSAMHGINTNTDSCFTYIPNTNYIGKDTIEIKVCDTQDSCTVAYIFIDITNRVPIVPDLSFTTPYQTPDTECILNVFEPDGQPVTISISQQPDNGTAVMQNGNCINYVPDNGFVGTDVIYLLVCDNLQGCTTAEMYITVLPPGNNAPVITNEPYVINTFADSTKTLCITATDPNGDVLTYTIEGGVANGTGSFTNNCFTYNANSTYTGTFTVLVKVCDDQNPALCDNTTITINVAPNNLAPIVNPATETVKQGSAVTVCPTFTDPNANDTHIFTILTPSQNGSTLIVNDSCAYYEPANDFVGIDSFIVQICDNAGLCDTALITINVTDGLSAANNTQTAEDGIATVINVLANDIYPNIDSLLVTLTNAPEHGTATVNPNGSITYTANEGFTGNDTLYYQICYGSLGCDQAMLVITVQNALQANNDLSTTPQNTSVDISILTNDIYPNDLLSVSDIGIITQPAHGAISINQQTGIVTYLPNDGFTGNDYFTYVICYTNIGCDTATVQISVDGTPAPAIANPDNATVTTSAPTTNIAVLANDSPANNLNVTAITDQPNHGTATINTDGSITYTANSGFVGTDTFIYNACRKDAPTICDTAIVIVTITGTNTACEIKVYQTFSPNGDNKNDALEIDGLDCDGNNQNELIIFNRWGNKVYETTNYVSGTWKGTYNDQELPSATYYYILKVASKNFEKAGFIEIYR